MFNGLSFTNSHGQLTYDLPHHLTGIIKTTTTWKTKYTVPLPQVRKRVGQKWVMPEPKKVPPPKPYEPLNSEAVLCEVLKIPDVSKKTALEGLSRPKADPAVVRAKMAPVLSIYSRPGVGQSKPSAMANVVSAATKRDAAKPMIHVQS